jgi:hypothetical protein
MFLSLTGPAEVASFILVSIVTGAKDPATEVPVVGRARPYEVIAAKALTN